MEPSSQAAGVMINADAVGLAVELIHGPSGTRLSTQPPKDNGGTGATFSPTDLVAAALASCAVTTMALAASREGLRWGETHAQIEKRMTPPPRRIGELELKIVMPAGFPPELRTRFEEIARTCPVARSLHPEVKVPLRFEYL